MLTEKNRKQSCIFSLYSVCVHTPYPVHVKPHLIYSSELTTIKNPVLKKTEKKTPPKNKIVIVFE